MADALTSEPSAVDTESVQRRAVSTLVGSQAAGGLGMSVCLAVGALLVTEIFDREDLSGLMQSSQVLGAALLAMPAASLAISHGRRVGLSFAFGLGAVGAGIVVLATQAGTLPLVMLGMALVGGGTTAGLQARYAATDLAPEERRGRALSVVVWATTVGAVAGPNLAGPAGTVGEALGIERLAGPFLFGAVFMGLGALIIWTLLRPDPLLTARSLDPKTKPATGRRRGMLRAGWSAISASPRALLGLVAIVVAHTVMVSVMVMTPIHMEHGHATLTIIGLVISIHIAGMFALSPVMGWLVDTVGRIPTLFVGVVVQALAVLLAGTAPEGHSAGLTAGLFLLGLGWSASTVAGSTLLTDAVDVDDRPVVQGASDLLMGLAAAGGGALAGVVVNGLGFGVLNVGAGALLVIPAVMLVLTAARR